MVLRNSTQDIGSYLIPEVLLFWAILKHVESILSKSFSFFNNEVFALISSK